MRDAPVIFDQVALGIPVFGPKGFCQIGEAAGDIFDPARPLRFAQGDNSTWLFVLAHLPTSPLARFPELHTLLRLLILTKPEEHRLPQQSFLGPLSVLDLAHQPRLYP